MKLTAETVAILKNYAAINQNIQFKEDDGIITADPHDEHSERFGSGSFKGIAYVMVTTCHEKYLNFFYNLSHFFKFRHCL